MSLLARAPRQLALRTRLSAPARFAHGHGEYKVRFFIEVPPTDARGSV